MDAIQFYFQQTKAERNNRLLNYREYRWIEPWIIIIILSVCERYDFIDFDSGATTATKKKKLFHNS